MKILGSQATRLRQELARSGDPLVASASNEDLLTGQDIIGPEPEDIRTKSGAWRKLEEMVGLDAVKAAISRIFKRAKDNYHKEINGEKLMKTSLNRVFIADTGLLSTREIVYKIPADFIGKYIGESESNSGLQRRFPLDQAFRFTDYDDKQLRDVLELKMREEIKATDAAMEFAAEVLRRNPEVIHGTLSLSNDEQDSAKPDLDDMTGMVLEPVDFDPYCDRGAAASEKCRALFDVFIGFEEIIQRFEGYQRVAENMRVNSKDPKETVPFIYVFKGPPGTGKTRTAGIIGQTFGDMGFLSKSEVECSAADLIRPILGSHRTQAGYTREMDLLMKVNVGPRGRFVADIYFPSLKPLLCLDPFRNEIKKNDIELLEEEEPNRKEIETVLRLFLKLSMTKSWSNARDVQTLASSIATSVYGSREGFTAGKYSTLFITKGDLIEIQKDMLRQRIKSGAAKQT
ncbi:hypothetical protein DL770_003843 [Monosporascus sp. CRB-9-2]|nr:hypothetical protein DL770_003843 [Monosporascus sp. CRB-9-2]